MKKAEDNLEPYIGICLLIVSLYTGYMMLYQLILYFLIAWCGKKFLDSKVNPYIETIAVQASLIVMVFIGLLQIHFVSEIYFTNFFAFISTIFTLIGLVWLVKAPGQHPVIMLTIFHLALIILAIFEMLNMNIGSFFHKAFANSIIWRLIGLLLMWLAYSRQVITIHSNPSFKRDDQGRPLI